MRGRMPTVPPRAMLLAACLWCAWGYAGDTRLFYVSPAGDDTGAGTRNAPFRTIQRAADALRPGDRCIVRGGTYRETVRPPNSGTAEKPVVFEACAGESVVVSGTEMITEWTQSEGGIWSAPCAGPAEQVFWDGAMLPLACWPNGPGDPMQRVWAQADEGSDAKGIRDPDLPGVDLAGATAHILPGDHWVSWTLPVESCDPAAHQIAFTAAWSQDRAHAVRKGTRYFLFGATLLLDAPGEWCFDAAQGRIFLLPPAGADPNAHRLEVKHRTLAFDLSQREHVTVSGFRVFAGTITLSDARHCVILDCHVRYASHFTDAAGWAGRNDSGIIVGGRDNLLRRCSVVYSAGNGYTLLGESNTIEQCLARNTDYIAGDCASVWAEGAGNVVRNCTLSDSGRSLIIHRALRAGRIEFNHLYRAGLMTADLGATYCFQTDGAGTVIAYNWIHDNCALATGVGIYIDNGSSNFLIHHNVSWNNPDSGIRLNTPSHNNRVYYNTVFQNGNSLGYWGPENNDDQQGCVVRNNIFTDAVATGAGAVYGHNFEGSDPGFVDPAANDFRLKPNSPCIDAGIAIGECPATVRGAAPDMGAYEFDEPRWVPGHDWSEPPVF